MTNTQPNLWGNNTTPPCQHGRTHHCPYCPTPRARNTDPDTSHQAAASAAPQAAIIRDLVYATLTTQPPLTDEQLVNHFYKHHWPGTPSGIRTRRNELTQQGKITRHHTNGTTTTGRTAARWTTP